ELKPLPERDWDIGDRWIASRFHRTANEINAALNEFRYDLAANSAYQFLWHEFCDWYIEWIKPHLGDDQPKAAAKKALLLQRICEVLQLLHPFVPFVTEYLWQQIPLAVRPDQPLAISPYPLGKPGLIRDDVEQQFGALMEVIGKIRQVRTEMNIEPAKKIHVMIRGLADPQFLKKQEKEILLLIRGEKLEFVKEFPPNMPLARGALKDCEVAINLEGVLDLGLERERLTRELKRIDADLSQTEKKLSNENFLKNAPAEVIEEQKAKNQDLRSRKV